MTPERSSTIAWAALAAGVAGYDILCKPGGTLSEGVDRALERPFGKVAAIGAVALVSSHLINLIPAQYDPFSRLLSFKNKVGESIDCAMDVFDD